MKMIGVNDSMSVAQDLYNEAYSHPGLTIHRQVKHLVPKVEAEQLNAYTAALRKAVDIIQQSKDIDADNTIEAWCQKAILAHMDEVMEGYR